MRGRDPETGQFLAPSRSQQRRDALAVLALAEQLVALGERELSAIPMPDDLRELARDSRRITAQIARKRQLQFLAKVMRREDDEVIETIRRALQPQREDARRDTARLHRLEAWRERLLDEGDEALTELIAQYPAADRQKLRQLIRNARSERERQRPPHAFRELFRELKALMRDDGLDDTDDSAPSDATDAVDADAFEAGTDFDFEADDDFDDTTGEPTRR